MNRKITDKLATGVFGLCAAVIAAILAGLFLYILIHGVSEISLRFLTSKSSAIASGGGIRDQLFNSFYILFITMLITIPLGVGAASLWLNMRPKIKSPILSERVLRCCLRFRPLSSGCSAC